MGSAGECREFPLGLPACRLTLGHRGPPNSTVRERRLMSLARPQTSPTSDDGPTSDLPPAGLLPMGADRPSVKFVVILGALIAIGPLTIDTYLPAFPSITSDLETTSAAVQLTLTGTLIGLALG